MALSIVCGRHEQDRLDQIEKFMGQKLERGVPPTSGGSLDFLKPTHQTLLILAGRKDKLRKGDVLGSLIKEGGIPPEAIGRIDVRDRVCAVALTPEFAQKARTHLREGRIKKRRFRSRLLD